MTEKSTSADEFVVKAFNAGFGGTYDHTVTETAPGTYQWGTPGTVYSGPTETELRLRESAIALTIEYFKGRGEVDLPEFDTMLTKFTEFLQSGPTKKVTTNAGTATVTF